ncbi:MAG: LytTR family transcriptional regulator [Clostridia bacterium]|nr:LytTR family transcriptional regulator [Clostridia bacterium]
MKYKLIIDKDAEEEIIAIVHSPSPLTQQIENLVCSFSGADSIVGCRDDERCRLTFSEIECITVLDRKVIAVDTNGKQYRLQDRLRDLEEVLPSYFIRINKSALANEHRIERFDSTFSGGVDAVFRCGYRDYVSRRCFAQIRRRYEGI